MEDIINRIRLNYGLWILLGINILIFCLLLFIKHSLLFSDSVFELFALPASMGEMIHKPWTLISYMFFHDNISHLVSNLLCLLIIGSLASVIIDSKGFISLYIIGGLMGAIFFLFFYSAIPPSFSANNYLQGASASIYSILVLLTLKRSVLEFKIKYLVYFPLKWIVGALLLLNLLGLTGENYAANFSHLGGAFAGVVFYIFYRLSGKDTSAPNEGEKELEKIMEKIKNSGYSSLSKEEKKSLLDRDK